jgi:hypothetical protein
MKSIEQYNLGDCSVGITGGSYLWSAQLNWPQTAWHTDTKFRDDRFSNSSNINGITSTTSDAVVFVLQMTGLS